MSLKKTILYSEGSICRSTIFAKLPHIMNFVAQFAPFLLSKDTVVYREAMNTIWMVGITTETVSSSGLF